MRPSKIVLDISGKTAQVRIYQHAQRGRHALVDRTRIPKAELRARLAAHIREIRAKPFPPKPIRNST